MNERPNWSPDDNGGWGDTRRPEWAKVRDLLVAAMMMANAWDAMGCPQDATYNRMQEALKGFDK